MALMIALISFLSITAGSLAFAATCPYKCPFPIQKVNGQKSIVFAVIGDWGRTGGNLSTTNSSLGGYDQTGWCSNPAFGFAAPDFTGGVDQHFAATAMNTVCRDAKCSFIVSTGDNFYECGLDNPYRWESDWKNVYQTPEKTAIKDLKWYNVIGNHDIVAEGSVDAQVAYGSVNSKWVANRTYGFEVHNSDSSIRLRFGAINTNSFVTKYGKANYKYNTSEFRAYASPSNITYQLDFLEGALSSSKATWDVVLGHHPVFGPTSANGYNASAFSAFDNGAWDLGRPDARGRPSWSALIDILRKYNPAAYMNGHDHSQAVAKDPNSTSRTAYLTSGSGSLPDSLCIVAGYRKNLLYSGANELRNTNATEACPGLVSGKPLGPNYSGPQAELGHVGFSIVTVTQSTFTIDMYLSDLGLPTKTYTMTLKQKTSKKLPAGCTC